RSARALARLTSVGESTPPASGLTPSVRPSHPRRRGPSADMPKKLQRKVAPKNRAAVVPAGKAAGAGPASRGGLLQSRRVTTKLPVLLDAGIPVTRCLRVLEGQLPPGAMKRALIEFREDVESGMSLSDAFAKHDRIFDTLYTNMVAAGEAGGVQDVILNRL